MRRTAQGGPRIPGGRVCSPRQNWQLACVACRALRIGLGRGELGSAGLGWMVGDLRRLAYGLCFIGADQASTYRSSSVREAVASGRELHASWPRPSHGSA